MQLHFLPPSGIVSNKTISKILTNLRAPEMNEKRQTTHFIEKCNSQKRSTNFPIVHHSSSYANTKDILSKVLRVVADLSALKSHVKC